MAAELKLLTIHLGIVGLCNSWLRFILVKKTSMKMNFLV